MLPMFASGGLLLLLDQWSKREVVGRLRDRSISWGPLLQIRCVVGLKDIYRRDGGRVVLVIVWLVALISAILLHRSGPWFQSSTALIGLGLTLGGALGNLLDILRWRHVVDFIDLRWWPVFNLADVAIISGLALAIWQRI